MSTYSEINIEYLEGFECDDFSIVDGCYIGNVSKKIDLIRTHKTGIIIQDKEEKILVVLMGQIYYDRNILNSMLSHCTYNKRKQIIEKLSI